MPHLHPLHPLHPLCPLCLPSGTTVRDIKPAGSLTRAAHASPLGVRPAAGLAPPGEACRRVSAGQAGPRAREAWGQVGGLEGGQWANFSAFPSFLPMSGWESAGFPQTCAGIRTDVLSTPRPSQAHTGDFREQKMYRLGYMWGSELWVMTKLSMRSYKPICRGDMSPRKGINFPRRHLLQARSRAGYLHTTGLLPVDSCSTARVRKSVGSISRQRFSWFTTTQGHSAGTGRAGL